MISLQNLVFFARGRKLIDSASLEARSGEIVALIGPNGAGKSTLLGLAAGDLFPHKGRILLRGEELRTMPMARRARLRAVVPQSASSVLPAPVFEVVLAGRYARLSRGESREDLEAAEAAMVVTETTHLAERCFSTLSGGERQRVQIARAYAQLYPFEEPRALLLDEPTASLDLAHQEAVLELARVLADRGVAVLIVLHDLGLAARFADRVVLLHEGRIVAADSPSRVIAPHVLEPVFGVPMAMVRHPDDGSALIVPRRVSPPFLKGKTA